MGEIDEEIYGVAVEELQQKKDQILVELESAKKNLSNLDNNIE